MGGVFLSVGLADVVAALSHFLLIANRSYSRRTGEVVQGPRYEHIRGLKSASLFVSVTRQLPPTPGPAFRY